MCRACIGIAAGQPSRVAPGFRDLPEHCHASLGRVGQRPIWHARNNFTATELQTKAPTTPRHSALGPTGSEANGLSIYLQAAPEDREAADRIAQHLVAAGASVLLSPDLSPGQTFIDGLRAQEDALRLCDGVLLLYGHSPAGAVSVAFQYALRVFGVMRVGVWSAVLSLPPPDKSTLPVRSRNLLHIDCRHGFDVAQLQPFFSALRRQGEAQYA